MRLHLSETELRDLLVSELEVIEQSDFDQARRMAARLRIPLERAIVERTGVPYPFLLRQLAQAWEVGFTTLDVSEIQAPALLKVPEAFARAQCLVAFDQRDRRLRVALRDPRDRRVITEVERLSGLGVEPHLASEQAILRGQLLYKPELRDMLGRAGTDADDVVTHVRWTDTEDGAAAELVTRMLEYAALVGASDIHVEPYEMEVVVRCRIDSALQEILALPAAALPSLVSRIKVLAQLRLDERRVPQDGRFEADLGGLKLDLRVSSVPTLWGEKVVMRVLPKDSDPIDLEDLGLPPADLQVLVRHITSPHGMVLITGPTGSGKTSTLYAALVRLGTERQNVVNISTVEDPVEYTIPRVNQIPLNTPAGMGFAVGLRALLRQDPDIIMVGEIRDIETAEIAVRAALVGRLLLSTLHTNDSVGAVPRLLDMGVEPYLVASTLTLVVAQRLVRRLCDQCRESVTPSAAALAALRERPDFDATVAALRDQGILGGAGDPIDVIRLFRGKGCRHCHGTGFKGRLGLFELYEVGETARRLIMERREVAALRAEALGRGMKTLFQDGLAKAVMGQTTIEEVLRVTL